MSIVAAMFVRLTHTGFYEDGRPNTASITIYDLDEITISKTRERAVPVPAGGFVDVPMSTRTFVSYNEGSICGLVKRGLITAQLFLQLRDKQHCGGPTGDGIDLQAAVLNAERVSNVLRLVIPDNVIPLQLDAVGFLAGENISITGLTAGFSQLDGAYTLTTATPATGLAGPAVGSLLLEMPSVGPDIAQATLIPGTNIKLTDGRQTVVFSSGGDIAGLGANVFGYVAGQLFPTALGGGGGSLTVLDENVPLPGNPFTTLNFIGADVLAQDGAPGVANIFIPPPAFLSHWDTSDGTNGAQLAAESSSRTVVRISTPAGGPGNPFAENGWAATNQDGSIDSPVTFTTPGNTTGFGGTSTMTVTLFDADGTTPLDTFTTAFLTGNGVFTSGSGRLSVTLSGFAADSTRFQANALVTVDVDGVFVDNGREGGHYHVEVTHTTDPATDGTGPYTYTQSDLFYDDNPTTPAINGGTTIIETAGSQVVKHLSGLEYYNLGSVFTVTSLDLDQLNRDTQRIPHNLEFRGTEYGLPDLDHAPFGTGAANFTFWNNNHNTDNVNYQNLVWAITAANYRLLSPTANVTGQPRDPWALGALDPSPDANILIDTFGITSSDLGRDYDDEDRRQGPLFNGGLAAGNWNSQDDLNTISYTAGTSLHILAAPLTAGDQFTIGGTTFTGVAGPRTPGANDFDASLVTVALLRAEIEAAINDPLNGTAGVVTAAPGLSAFDDVFVVAVAAGAAGNGIATTSGTPGAFATTFPFATGFGGVPAQVWNSNLVVPSATTLIRPDGPNSANANWTAYSPNTLGANPDYTPLVAPATHYETFVDTSGLFRSSGQLVFSGSFAGGDALADIVSGDLEIYVLKRSGSVGAGGPPPGNTRQLTLNGPNYNFATFDDGLSDNHIREATSLANTINFTFGGFAMLNGIHFKICINNSAIQIDSIAAIFF